MENEFMKKRDSNETANQQLNQTAKKTDIYF